MNGVVRVVRVQLVNKQTFVWMPLIVLAGVTLLSMLVFALIPTDGPKYSGAGQAPLWYMLAVGAMALTRTFPFSQALSITRRDYLVGTMTTAALTSAGLATAVVIGGQIERATGGWGMNGWLFGFEPLMSQGPLVAWLTLFVIGLLFFSTGVLSATLYKRVGALWLTVIWVVGSAVVIGVAVMMFTVDGVLPAVLWLQALPLLGWAGIAALALAAQTGVTYGVLRRTQP